MDSNKKEKETMTMEEVLEEQTLLEEEAKEVLPFDITRCSKPLGQIRQFVYSCLTCNPILPDHHQRAGVCSSCSVSCHTDHQLVELFIRRNFVCDCGTARCNLNQCSLDHSSNPLFPIYHENQSDSKYLEDSQNKYDQNFDGKFCICERGQHYDPNTETEDMYQCLACEDWRHVNCLGPHPNPDEWEDLICAACVQNDPIISSIMFKYAGGDNTGMLVCTNSEPDQILCYGRLSSTLNPEPLDPPINPAPCSTIKEISNPEPHIDSNSSILSIPKFANNPLPLDSNLLHQQEKVDEKSKKATKYENLKKGDVIQIPNAENVQSKNYNEDVKQQDENLKLLNNKRSTSPSFQNQQSEINYKKQKFEKIINTTSLDIKETFKLNNKLELISNRNDSYCKAPFKDKSESILNKLDPKFANVYLVDGWRKRWCNCVNCFSILSKLNWLIHEEEEVWEPGEDVDSLKSIHELGLEAMKKLPRDQLINGMNAYNQFKNQFLNFLKPFHSDNKLITESDIHSFFQNIKKNI